MIYLLFFYLLLTLLASVTLVSKEIIRNKSCCGMADSDPVIVIYNGFVTLFAELGKLGMTDHSIALETFRVDLLGKKHQLR